MRKIPTLFVRNPEDRRYVTSEVTPGCEWVLAGEGVATRKYDGTCVLRDPEGGWYARREVKHGKTPPPGWFEADCDPVTRKSVGWEPIGGSAFVKFFDEAVKDLSSFRVGTYELCGPKINGNPEQLMRHTLIPHALADTLPMSPRTFDGLRDWLGSVRYEGIVWHHPDGRMAKLKARDFPRTDA